MTDVNAARILAHQGNIVRYRRILSTPLTELERSFVIRRLAEEQKSLWALWGFVEAARDTERAA